MKWFNFRPENKVGDGREGLIFERWVPFEFLQQILAPITIVKQNCHNLQCNRKLQTNIKVLGVNNWNKQKMQKSWFRRNCFFSCLSDEIQLFIFLFEKRWLENITATWSYWNHALAYYWETKIRVNYGGKY